MGGVNFFYSITLTHIKVKIGGVIFFDSKNTYSHSWVNVVVSDFAAQKQLTTRWVNVVVSLHICGKHLLPMWVSEVVVGYES